MAKLCTDNCLNVSKYLLDLTNELEHVCNLKNNGCCWKKTGMAYHLMKSTKCKFYKTLKVPLHTELANTPWIALNPHTTQIYHRVYLEFL